MKRNSKISKKADAILTADIEFRMYPPICRTDDYWAAFKRKIDWLNKLQQKHECPVFDAGDLFDKKYKVNPSHELLGYAMQNLPRPFYTVPGNHDLPGKSLDNYSNSAMAVLEDAGVLTFVKSEIIKNLTIRGFPWGYEIKNHVGVKEYLGKLHSDGVKAVAIVHAMVYKEFEPWPGCEGHSAQEVMDLLPGFDLIVTGHNHQTFTHEDNGRMLVNPGSLMRNDADQIDHKPCVFLWYADTNSIKPVYAPIEQGVISRQHIDDKNARESRMDAFVEKLGGQATHGVDFIKNLEVATKKQSQAIQDKVWKYVEGL